MKVTDRTCSRAEKFSLELVVPCDTPCHLLLMKKIIFFTSCKYVRCIGGGGLSTELNSASNDVNITDRTCSGVEKLSLELIVPCDTPCHLPLMKKIMFSIIEKYVRCLSGSSAECNSLSINVKINNQTYSDLEKLGLELVFPCHILCDGPMMKKIIVQNWKICLMNGLWLMSREFTAFSGDIQVWY